MNDSLNSAWLYILDHVLEDGSIEAPRGLKTREVIASQFTFDMHYPVLTIKGRQLGYRFLAAEAWWIMSGSNRVDTIAPYSKMISKFSDDGLTFRGAYGPKIMEQLPYVADCLARDPSSRQALLTIWRERPGSSKDIPCTVSLQWFIRSNSLHCVVNMRSSDAWLGVPYDTFNFSMLSAFLIPYIQRVRKNLGFDTPFLDLGNQYFNAGSQHLYEQHWEPARACIRTDDILFAPKPFDATPWQDADPYDLVEHLKALADRKQHDTKCKFLDEVFNLFKDENRDDNVDAQGKPRGY